jgi:hypothetical protein
MLLFFFAIVSLAGASVRIDIQNTNTPLAGKIEGRAEQILNACSRYYELNQPLQQVKPLFRANAFHAFTQLVRATRFYPVYEKYKTTLIKTSMGGYEIRGLRVRVVQGKTRGSPNESLVMAFDADGQVLDIHFALEKRDMNKILQYGQKVKQQAYLEKIKHFIENYKTAYNAKDLSFIERTLSDDALIIVGYEIRAKDTQVDMMQRTTLSEENIEYIHKSKSDYLKALKQVFKRNDYIHVKFDNIEIQKYPDNDEIFGVKIKQYWNASTYSDEGYLFLMIDFQTPEEPIIHVRAWQKQPFQDGSTLDLFFFEVIEPASNRGRNG